MEVNAKKLDKALHLIPVVINHLQAIELELVALRQTILTSIEDDNITEGVANGKQTD
jgi:hypothetical protein